MKLILVHFKYNLGILKKFVFKHVIYSCLNIEHTITPQYNQNSLEISGVDEINEVDSYEIAKENHGEE